ncbi:hypothetical protein ACFWZ2_21665 [Streptomyces sp. NPDC059002]|uniref:nSTAND1 domain-containing NTPase n=1 Tax=Streptomyces sp. NPDC059002 TaxID=3346690 RepID=UPI0036C02DA8
MERRGLKLAVNVLVLIGTTLLGIVLNYATSGTSDDFGPLRFLRDRSLPLLGVVVLLLIGCTWWLHLLDRPVTARPAWDSSQPPYPGLEAFTEADAGVFFGRDREVRELVGRLRGAGAGGVRDRVAVVIGPSGSGKSSLVAAGLLPALAKGRERWSVVPPFAPGAEPVPALAARLADAGRLRAGRGAPVLVVVDQLEELFTLSGERDREEFLTRVGGALAADPHLWIVATLRSDFLTDLLESGHADLVRHPLLLGVLGRAELFDVIERPARAAGLAFPPGLVARMVDDTGGGDALPLLAYTLQALFLRSGTEGSMAEADYLQLGGVAGALAEQADRIAAGLRAADASAPVLAVLLKFVTLEHGEHGAPTRRRVRRADLAPRERAVADAFVEGRLLTGDGDVIDVCHEALFRQWAPLREAVAEAAEVLRWRTELERLAQDWEHSGRRAAYLLGGERLAAVRGWLAQAPDVLGGTALIDDFLAASVRRDSAALVQVADAVARRAIETADRDPELALLAALAAIDECAPTSVAQRALQVGLRSARRCAVFRGNGGNVRALSWSPDGERLAAAYEDGRVRIWATEPGGVGREPLTVLVREGGEGGEDDSALTVAWSPDGRRLVAGFRDCRGVIWDTASWAECGVLPGSWGGSAAWSHDSARIAMVSLDGLRVWDAGTCAEVMVLSPPLDEERQVWRVDWSRDGRWLAGAADGGWVWVWGMATGEPGPGSLRHRLTAADVAWSHQGGRLASVSEAGTVAVSSLERGVWSDDTQAQRELVVPLPCVTWSPDDVHIAVGDNEKTVHVWNVLTNERLALSGHGDCVNDIAWQGDRIATASRDGTVSVWDMTTTGTSVGTRLFPGGARHSLSWSPDGARIATCGLGDEVLVQGPAPHGAIARLRQNGEAADAAWSPDGTRLAAVTRTGMMTVHDSRDMSPMLELPAPGRAFTSVAWSPDGTCLVTTENDGGTRLRDARDGTHLLTLEGDRQWLARPAWSPGGSRLLTSLTRSSACVWDVTTGTRLTLLEGHTDYTVSVAWSPDGRRVATGSRDRTVRVWDPGTGAELACLTGHEERVQGLGWSPDGTRLATGSWDGTVRLWDPDEGRELAVVGIHDDQVNDLAWSPDGTRLATVSRDRTVRLWNPAMDLDELLALARSRVFRALTDEERRELLLPARR